jgi:hypothetical protein
METLMTLTLRGVGAGKDGSQDEGAPREGEESK